MSALKLRGIRYTLSVLGISVGMLGVSHATDAQLGQIVSELTTLNKNVSQGWGQYFNLQQGKLYGVGDSSLTLLWAGMDYQHLNQLPTVSADSVPAPILPSMIGGSGQVSAVVNVVNQQIGAMYQAPQVSSTGTSSLPVSESQMQLLHDAVLAPFQNPANNPNNPASASTNPGWLVQINTASPTELLRAVAVELALNNELQYQQLKIAQLNAATNAQILAQQSVLAQKLSDIEASINGNTNTQASLMMKSIELQEEHSHE